MSFFPVIAKFEARSEAGAALARNGGRLVLEEGRVAAYCVDELVGYVDSPEVLAHLTAGGTAHFRLDAELMSAPAVCMFGEHM